MLAAVLRVGGALVLLVLVVDAVGGSFASMSAMVASSVAGTSADIVLVVVGTRLSV